MVASLGALLGIGQEGLDRVVGSTRFSVQGEQHETAWCGFVWGVGWVRAYCMIPASATMTTQAIHCPLPVPGSLPPQQIGMEVPMMAKIPPVQTNSLHQNINTAPCEGWEPTNCAKEGRDAKPEQGKTSKYEHGDRHGPSRVHLRRKVGVRAAHRTGVERVSHGIGECGVANESNGSRSTGFRILSTFPITLLETLCDANMSLSIIRVERQ